MSWRGCAARCSCTWLKGRITIHLIQSLAKRTWSNRKTRRHEQWSNSFWTGYQLRQRQFSPLPSDSEMIWRPVIRIQEEFPQILKHQTTEHIFVSSWCVITKSVCLSVVEQRKSQIVEAVTRCPDCQRWLLNTWQAQVWKSKRLAKHLADLAQGLGNPYEGKRVCKSVMSFTWESKPYTKALDLAARKSAKLAFFS